MYPAPVFYPVFLSPSSNSPEVPHHQQLYQGFSNDKKSVEIKYNQIRKEALLIKYTEGID